MAACQGALLLIDATRMIFLGSLLSVFLPLLIEGIQAQSISVYHVAKERGVHIIPVLNKV
jgi:translation elongation factor EF-4